MVFKTLDISRGSVATQLRCGGIFSDGITNVLLILTVKYFRKLVYSIKLRHNVKIIVPNFFGPPCIYA